MRDLTNTFLCDDTLAILLPMDPNALISVQNMSFVRQPHLALQHLNFSLKAGECMVFIGANGTGKTTTLHLLAGLIPPDTGKIWIQGFDLETDPLNAKHSLGFLSDHLPLYTELTIYEYLDLIARLRQIPKHLHSLRIQQTLEELNLTRLQHVLIGSLSKGQKQRVGIAQAMLHQPRVLLLDEPTQGLDPDQIECFINHLKIYKKNAAVILSTNAFNEVEPLCDHVLKFDPSGANVYDFHPCKV